jgi:hypothetical protein
MDFQVQGYQALVHNTSLVPEQYSTEKVNPSQAITHFSFRQSEFEKS